jgi:hypothetical protein
MVFLTVCNGEKHLRSYVFCEPHFRLGMSRERLSVCFVILLFFVTPVFFGRRGGGRECVWSGYVFKVKQGFWGMPRGSVPMKDVPSGDTRWGAASAQ